MRPQDNIKLMKRSVISAILAVAATFSMGAQLPVGMNPPYPPAYYGTMMPVQLPPDIQEAPDSLTPLFVNHIGRHGARFMSSDKKVKRLGGTLDRALAASSLSTDGHRLAAMVREVERRTDGRWGALDSLGHAEQTAIATALNSALPGFFTAGNIMAMSSYVPRCVESMYTFCHRLGQLDNSLQITASSGPDYDALLRFFDTDMDYARWLGHGSWKKIYDSYVEANVPLEPARRLFSTGYLLPESELRKITLDIYALLQSLPAAGINASPAPFLTPGEFEACWKASNLYHALERTATPWSKLPARAAGGLLREIVSSTQTFIDDPAARNLVRGMFRFGHAETIMPLFSLMGLPGCTVPDNATPETLSDYWTDSYVSPLGASFMLIIYRSPSGGIYARTLLNGRPVIPWPEANATIVPWGALRDYWMKKTL